MLSSADTVGVCRKLTPSTRSCICSNFAYDPDALYWTSTALLERVDEIALGTMLFQGSLICFLFKSFFKELTSNYQTKKKAFVSANCRLALPCCAPSVRSRSRAVRVVPSWSSRCRTAQRLNTALVVARSHATRQCFFVVCLCVVVFSSSFLSCV